MGNTKTRGKLPSRSLSAPCQRVARIRMVCHMQVAKRALYCYRSSRRPKHNYMLPGSAPVLGDRNLRLGSTFDGSSKAAICHGNGAMDVMPYYSRPVQAKSIPFPRWENLSGCPGAPEKAQILWAKKCHL